MSELLDTCDRVLGMVGGRAEARVRVHEGTSALTRFANSRIHQNVAEEGGGVSLLVALNGRVASGSTNRTGDESLVRLVESSLAAAALSPPDPDWPGMAPPADVADVDHYDPATADASPDVRAEGVKAFVDAGQGLESAGYFSTSGHTVALSTSAGQRVEGRSTSAGIDGIHRAPLSDGVAAQDSWAISGLDAAALGAVAAAKARAGQGAADIDPGHYEVVLEPRCTANILQFLVLSGFNAKAHADGTSFVSLGEQQLDQAIDIYDDATDARSAGLAFDAEGTPKRRVDLVTAGVSRSLAHDRRTAAQAGVQSTGHGFGNGSFGAFPTNLFLAGGSRSVEEMVGSIDRGLLVSDFWYTRILDPKTQVVTGLTRNGLFLIEGGQITRPVTNLRFTQSFVAALSPGRVKEVGNDARLIGSMHIPSLHLESWAFTGGAKG